MDRRLTLPAFGALVLSASALGMYLGESAIAQINPLYFQGPAVHPRDRGAAIQEPLPARGQRFADLYGWEDGQAARSADCFDCAALGARDSYAAGPQFAVIEPSWRAEPQPAAYALEPEPQAPPEEEAAPVEPNEVERYAAFPIEEKEPAAAAPAAETEPEPAVQE